MCMCIQDAPFLIWFQVNQDPCIMHQSFETSSPPHPTPGKVGGVHSVWVWKPVKFPDTGEKILSEVSAPWYSAVQTKVPCVESAVTAFLKSSHQTLKAFLKKKTWPLMSNVQITKQRKNATTDKSMWIPVHLQRSESELSPHLPGKHKLVNMRWLYPLFSGHAQGGCGGGGVGERRFQMTGA